MDRLIDVELAGLLLAAAPDAMMIVDENGIIRMQVGQIRATPPADLAAAEDVSTKVLIDPETLPKLDDERPSDQLLVHGDTKTGRFNGRFLAPGTFVWADFEIPVAGEYRISIRGGNARRDLLIEPAEATGRQWCRGRADPPQAGQNRCDISSGEMASSRAFGPTSPGRGNNRSVHEDAQRV